MVDEFERSERESSQMGRDFVTKHENGPKPVVSGILSRDAVSKPFCQQYYQEIDNVSLLQCGKNNETKIVSAFIEGQESQPTEQIEGPGPPSD